MTRAAAATANLSAPVDRNDTGERIVATKATAPVMHVALLRGINVGKAKRIAMADLRDLCTSLGYRDVKTLLNSGNVVFAAPKTDPKAAAKIEAAIEKELGVKSRVLVVTGSVLDAIVKENPFDEGEANPSRFLVTVLSSAADRARIAEVAKQRWLPDRVGLGTHAAYLYCATGILESKAMLAVNKVIGDAGTSRNWATIMKLHALTRDGASSSE
jgi:uncharacterized protein (DUF1697 family)